MDDDDDDHSDTSEGEEEVDAEKGAKMTTLKLELRKALREMAMGEIDKLRKEGFNGMSLHEAAGFRSSRDFFNWMSTDMGSTDSPADDELDEGENEDDEQQKGGRTTGTGIAHAMAPSQKQRPSGHSLRQTEKEVAAENAKRKKKNAPRIEISTRPVKRDLVRSSFQGGLLVPSSKRELLNPTFEKFRDPRFDGVSTEHASIRKDLVDKNYNFLAEQRSNEIADLANKIRKSRAAAFAIRNTELSESKRQKLRKQVIDEGTLDQMQSELTKMQQMRANHLREVESREVLSQHMKREREMVSTGAKSPFFLKRREREKLVLAKRFENLEKEGQLDKTLEKRRRQNAKKDRRMVPKGGPVR